ncbi:PQQ-like domain-containing protein [Variovorax sp. HW608]|nr:PQQ-binding-like beta-propeller repeat protein [Variovorax sp. HW608]SCK22597.1 PQQ-like domain-containing protein [Variovorax sp. HW608]
MNSSILMRTRRGAGRVGPLATLVAAVTLGCLAGTSAGGPFNTPGNILITDQFNNRVIEIDPSGTIVWSFGSGHGNTSAGAIVGTNDAERVGVNTLMSGTGIPAGATKNCKKSGCADNRVILVDPNGNIIWQYGQFNVTGFGPNQLNTPVQNTFLPDGHILITDQGNQRIIEVRPADNAIVWQYGQNGVAGSGPNQLSNPNAAELLANGNILISDENNNRAIEVTHTMPSQIVATFTAQGSVSGVAFASRLASGNTLITDSNNARIVEVNSQDVPVWQYVTNTRPGSNPAPLPTRAVRLATGNTLISDQFNDQVIEVNPSMQIVATYGTINDPGFSPSTAVQMNAPYSAYVIGDYTGITSPF